MDLQRLHRAALALIAAYAVALQALFTAFAPVLTSAAPMAVLCSGSVADGHPVEHDTLCSMACMALGQGVGVPPPPATIARLAVHAAVAFIPPKHRIAPVAMLGPQAPRGPPPDSDNA
jgi:hypothetical protein